MDYTIEANLPNSVKASLKVGDKVGEIVVYKNNVENVCWHFQLTLIHTRILSEF